MPNREPQKLLLVRHITSIADLPFVSHPAIVCLLKTPRNTDDLKGIKSSEEIVES
jgi:hypothetical protein